MRGCSRARTPGGGGASSTESALCRPSRSVSLYLSASLRFCICNKLTRQKRRCSVLLARPLSFGRGFEGGELAFEKQSFHPTFFFLEIEKRRRRRQNLSQKSFSRGWHGFALARGRARRPRALPPGRRKGQGRQGKEGRRLDGRPGRVRPVRTDSIEHEQPLAQPPPSPSPTPRLPLLNKKKTVETAPSTTPPTPPSSASASAPPRACSAAWAASRATRPRSRASPSAAQPRRTRAPRPASARSARRRTRSRPGTTRA